MDEGQEVHTRIEEVHSLVKAIHLEEDKTNIFKILKGVRQGDPISPKLFTAAMESVFRNLDWQSKGIVVDGEHLTHLRFADDILILSHRAQ